VTFTGPGADLSDDSVEGVKALHEAIGPTITLQNVYGYIQAIAVVDVLEQAIKDGDLSGTGLRKASTEIDKIEFQGLNGDLTLGKPTDRVLPQTTTIYKYDPATPYGLSAVAVQYKADKNGDGF
jgi:hypothetical protein